MEGAIDGEVSDSPSEFSADQVSLKDSCKLQKEGVIAVCKDLVP